MRTMGVLSTTRRRRRARRVLAASAVAVALGLAGCDGDGTAAGGEETTLSPAQLVSEAARKSGEKQTVSFTVDARHTRPGKPVISVKGQMDGRRRAIRMEVTGSVGSYTTTSKQLVLGDTLYVNRPRMADGTWVKEPMEATRWLSGGPGYTPVIVDPSQPLRLLRQVSDDVKEAGSETVNGVRTTKYSGTIETAKAAKARGGTPADAAGLLRSFKESGIAMVPFEVFIDGDGLVARVRITIAPDVPEARQAETHATVSTMDLADWGAAVDITAPKKVVTREQAWRDALGR